MRVIVVGNNKVACELLEWLVREGEEVVASIPENKDIANNVAWERAFLPVAEKYQREKGIPCYIGNINKYAGDIRKLFPDIIACCRSAALVQQAVLNISKITNLHYGMLPRYGGCDTIAHAILNGEKEIGVTLHYMNKKFDEGKILAQEAIDISELKRHLILPNRTLTVCGLTAHEVYQKANSVGFSIYCRQYALIKEGKEKFHEQDLTKKLYYKKGEIDYSRDGVIDLEKATDEEISRHIRAFTFPSKNSKAFGRIKDKIIELKLED